MHAENTTPRAVEDRNGTVSDMDPNTTLDHLREMTGRCLEPQSLTEGEFPGDYAVNALEALTTLVALDRWLSAGGHLPAAWSRPGAHPVTRPVPGPGAGSGVSPTGMRVTS
jgi:hypothetical protein